MNQPVHNGQGLEQPASATCAGQAVKRALDILAAALLLVLTAPLMLAVALAIPADGSRPVLFAKAAHGTDLRATLAPRPGPQQTAAVSDAQRLTARAAGPPPA